MNIKEEFIERYSKSGSNSITLEAIVPDMIIGVIILLLIDSFYMIVSGKLFAMMMTDINVLGFLHCILALLTAVVTFIFFIIEGPEVLSDIWYEVKDWEIFTFKGK